MSGTDPRPPAKPPRPAAALAGNCGKFTFRRRGAESGGLIGRAARLPMNFAARSGVYGLAGPLRVSQPGPAHVQYTHS
jgi:hypothetical protein